MCLQGREALLLYGGEYYDGAKPPHDKTYVYGDVHHYDVAKDAWRKIVSPKGCGPPDCAEAEAESGRVNIQASLHRQL